MGQLQGRYSDVYEESETETDGDTMIWRKAGREYEYKLI
jgi:hypothetical protein